MALIQDQIRAAAERLDRAEKTRTQIRQLSQEFPSITLDDSYAIQKAWIEIKVSAGRVVKGHKIGLTSKAMQSALNIDEPDSGVLLDDMFFADGGLVPTDRFIATRVEAELAFVMAKRLSGPDCTLFDVLNATDFVVPALEILDTRVERVDPATKATRKIFDTIADNAANAGIVLGGRPIRPLDAVPALDRRAVLQERPARRNRPCRRRAQSSRDGSRVARQQDRAARAGARARPGRARRLLHPSDRDPQGRHNPGRLWRLWLGQLLLRVRQNNNTRE
jgi:2-keto-4-pentenoate hydratase